MPRHIIRLAIFPLLVLSTSGYGMFQDIDNPIPSHVSVKIKEGNEGEPDVTLNSNSLALSQEHNPLDETKVSGQVINEFLGLPFEIHWNIFRYVGFADLLKSSVSGKYIHNLANTMAKERAQKDFCLSDQDMEGGSWLTTYIYHSLFWKGYKDQNTLEWLIKKDFYLAIYFNTFKEMNFQKKIRLDENERSTKLFLGHITERIQECILRTEDILKAFRKPLHFLAKQLPILSKDTNFRLDLPELISNTENSQAAMASLLSGTYKDDNWEELIQLLCRGLSQEEDRQNFIKDISNPQLPIGQLENTLFHFIQQGRSSFYEEQLYALHTDLLNTGSTQFLLFFQNDISFINGLSHKIMSILYYEAQRAYKTKFNPIFIGRFLTKSQLGLFYSDNEQDMIDDTKNWKRVVNDLHDPFIAYQLAKSWANARHPNSQENAKYWFEQHKELATHLPFGDFESLREK